MQFSLYTQNALVRIENLNNTISKIEDLGLETLPLKNDGIENLNYQEQAFVDLDGHLILLYQLLEN